EDDKDEKVTVSCEEVWNRGSYENRGEDNFSVAHIRIVYKDYHLQELILNLLYSTTNVFCYSIDKKASAIFKEQMYNLSQCFPNIHIASVEYQVDSAGHNMDRAFLSCMSLIRKIPHWQYAITMQNHDMPIKTNEEMLAILKVLNGSNSIDLVQPFSSRIPDDRDWSFKALQLFKNTSANDDRVLQITKGNVGSVHSRQFVEFLIDKINSTTFLSRFDKVIYGNDELYFPTLNADDNVGKFKMHEKILAVSSFASCYSHFYRHNTCIYGYKDLKVLKNDRHLFANKVLPSVDYTGIVCWAKYLAHRATIKSHEQSIPLKIYANMPAVRFNKKRTFWKKNLSKFNCATGN
ncbi:unnamed protein product, partial [Enterobius vermicularis]|uniref:Core-2/I-Branching enzyme n=1 Tax=Enterobius vermicularis TaxID=51028 RepID=A0A0N4UXZ6_ENTVE